MNVSDILSLAKAIETYSLAIEYVLSRRFKRKVVIIETPKNQRIACVKETDREIDIRDIQSVWTILRYFGPLIKHLQLGFYNNELLANQTAEIFQLVNLHCSKTLNVFCIENNVAKNMDFDEFNIPFKHVTEVRLWGEFYRLDSHKLKFVEIFPAMQKLVIEYNFKLYDKTSLEVRFPHLNR